MRATDEGPTEGLCVLRWEFGGHPWSCPLFCTAQVPALALEEKSTLPRGGQERIGSGWPGEGLRGAFRQFGA